MRVRMYRGPRTLLLMPGGSRDDEVRAAVGSLEIRAASPIVGMPRLIVVALSLSKAPAG
jgi:hypothetical protein